MTLSISIIALGVLLYFGFRKSNVGWQVTLAWVGAAAAILTFLATIVLLYLSSRA